ncbi:hypothetical protein DERF_010766 [Dermatophagoides farinae]|uniref:Uncharacterized protein n=1 Tax=Dermatophagoides farinae TaxID=6954 RepID=A0A922HRM0_DERFA|nr:hypothetical protein DERF_010766 [Dermatophagoides farinae]
MDTIQFNSFIHPFYSYSRLLAANVVVVVVVVVIVVKILCHIPNSYCRNQIKKINYDFPRVIPNDDDDRKLMNLNS